MNAAIDESKTLLVRRWGEMSGYWGISRTMAEIHAFLFFSTEPQCTDDIMANLHVSRGNASMNLRALVDWGLIQRIHRIGQRREYFEADTDIWHMFETIMRERRRREVEPILATVQRGRALVEAARAGGEATARYAQRLRELQEFLETMGRLFELVLRFGRDGLSELARMLLPIEASGQASLAPPPPAAPAPATRGSGRRDSTATTPFRPVRPLTAKREPPGGRGPRGTPVKRGRRG